MSLFLARCGLPALARTAVVAVGREIISHARTEKALQDSGACEIHPPFAWSLNLIFIVKVSLIILPEKPSCSNLSSNA